MNGRPTPFQKLFHQFFMLSQVTAFFAPWVHHVDQAILNLTKGNFTVTELLGWNIVQLMTVGAKTGQYRTKPLVALFDGEKIALVASSFGREHHPGWYYNLKANPECEVQYRGHWTSYIAHEADGDEREQYWQLALSYYAGYENYKARAGRRIPVMVLEPKR